MSNNCNLKMPANFAQARLQLPMLKQTIKDQPYIYLNNAATALKPEMVLARMDDYYRNYGVSIYRGADDFAYQASEAFEKTRKHVANFLNAEEAEEIVFTRGTTAAINLVALSYLANNLTAGDKVIISPMEHHANYLPWQQLCLRQEAELLLAPLLPDGTWDLSKLETLLDKKVKFVALTGISNLMGSKQPVAAICNLVHQLTPAAVLVDAAQWIVHEQIDVQALDCDFLAFSAHKLYGPTGIGCLYGKQSFLQSMPPLETGGEMIDIVDVYTSTFKDAPWRFEAGTMMVAEAIGLDAALDFVETYGLVKDNAYVRDLTAFAATELAKLDNIVVYNPGNNESGIIAFNVKNVHPHDAASVFAQQAIALRAGNHCAQPALRWLGIANCLRASLAFFNTEVEIHRFLDTAEKAGDFLSVLF